MTTTTTTPRKPRRVNPVKCEVVTHRRMVYACELMPIGVPAHITLNAKPYVVEVVEDSVVLHSSTDTHTVSRETCTCGDYTFVREARGEVCKHVLAVRKLKLDGTI